MSMSGGELTPATVPRRGKPSSTFEVVEQVLQRLEHSACRLPLGVLQAEHAQLHDRRELGLPQKGWRAQSTTELLALLTKSMPSSLPPGQKTRKRTVISKNARTSSGDSAGGCALCM
jgi:hypothetical protein